MHKALAGIILLGLGQLACAADSRASLEIIVSRLDPPDHQPRSFVERRQNRLLAEPMVFEGEVTLFADGTFSKVIFTPFSERVLVTAEFLELERKGKKRRLPVKSNRGARSLYAGIRAFLERDIDTLLSLFEVAAVDAGDPWRIELVPVARDMERYVARMIITGTGSRVSGIRTIQAEDNWQEMSFGASEIP